MRVVLSARAEIDLQEIFEESIARWGEQQARRYAEQLDARLALVARGNTRGRARPELGDGVHSLPAGSHVIFLKVTGEEATVLSVRHAHRRSPLVDELE
jgi:toxin ParE1/3/4